MISFGLCLKIVMKILGMINKKIISLLLHYANRYKFLEKNDIFFDIKSYILAQNAIPLGKQVQHIVNKCWSCNGSGLFSEYYDGFYYQKIEPRMCYRCNNGVYNEFHSLLVLWQFGKYQFHTFVDRIDGPLFHESYFRDLPILENIEGKVRKEKVKYWLGWEAYLWLILIYRREVFLSIMKKSMPCGRVYTPLCFINKIVFRLRRGSRISNRWVAKFRRFKDLILRKGKPVAGNDLFLPF